ncbi:alanine dehydrogenase [Microbacterium ulmi]|uniref:Alanine dehydrogenase n=1 Tax=Microbacterium ulmi TaxID=179095 RepID=A0A7Y2LYD3_9MICO|nr:alanine dehydrogenase [Microbacterium ulmi]NII68360.1 alanine dehydrogenase [Microbacterium ulmi]NNH03105.1 alanine dehydrogenase [Microbacterium ulmi]
MRIGVPTETKNSELRVALTPAGAHELVHGGHIVLVQSGAGAGSGFSDDEYASAGADLVARADDAWSAELVVKVKEPTPAEFRFLRPDLVLFTYLHLAADLALTRALLDGGTTAIAYETVQLADRSLPLLAPMSEVAGRLSVQVGSQELTSARGGSGILLGGVPGTPKANVVVLGGGTAGESAARIALGLGAHVTVLDISLPRLRQLDGLFEGRITTLRSSAYEVAAQLENADLVIGSVLVPGAVAPKIVTDEMVATARQGTVFVDVAIDQGGCFEGSHATTHDAPTFRVHDATFYCVANMPGAVPRTATQALTNATLPWVALIARHGVGDAVELDPAIRAGLTTRRGAVTNAAVAAAHDLRCAA